MKTVISGFVLTNFVSTIVITLLHLENRKRYKGTAHWILNYIFQTSGILLIALRGSIPDWVSIDLSNLLSVSGTLIGLIGLGEFTGIKVRKFHNYILILLFLIIHVWFTFVHPDLSIRNLNISVTGGLLFLQAFLLLIFKVPRENRKITRLTGSTYLIFLLISITRIVKILIISETSQDLFHEDRFESFILIGYQMNILFLTYSVVLMYNKNALTDIIFGEEKYYKAFNTALNGIMLTRFSDGRIVEVNLGFMEITGYSKNEIEGHSSIDLLWQDEDQREAVMNLLKKNGKVEGQEILMRKKNGNFYSLYSATLIKVKGVQHILSGIYDISIKKNAEEELHNLNAELENRVAERTIQLEESNKELEAFSYSVSHDLRAPLRAIHGFTRIFTEEYSGVLDEEGKRICSIVESSTIRMGNLIDDLLSLSRIERKELLSVNIDMESLAHEVISEQASALPAPDNWFEVKELPDATGDPGTMKIVYTNLISNAIKYSSKTRQPRIEIGSFTKNRIPVYYVRDNGVGFNMQFYDKMFKVFQRLHNSRDYEGNGVGLAIVDRIIKRHKGELWANGEPDKGALFCFTVNPESVSAEGSEKVVL